MRVLALCLLVLCACKNVDVPWQRPACAPLQLQGDPPELVSLMDVRAAGAAVLALWRGAKHTDDPLLLSVFDGNRWHQPYRLREHSTDLEASALSNGGVLLFSVDLESVQWSGEDAGASDGGVDAGSAMESPLKTVSFETQFAVVNDACNEVPLTKVRIDNADATSALTNSGLAALAWNDADDDAQAIIVRAAQEPKRTTLAMPSENAWPEVHGLTALSDNSIVATLIDRGRALGDPQRLFTRRFWAGRWQEPVEHASIEHPDSVGFGRAIVAAGPGSSAALLWTVPAAGLVELHMRRTNDSLHWNDDVLLHTDEQIADAQLRLAPDDIRLAAVWRTNDAWRALLVDGDEPIGEATEVGCTGRDVPSIVFADDGRLLIACGSDQGPATLASFDGTAATSVPLGRGQGAATQPKLTAVPAGPVIALWQQHEGPAYDVIDDMGVPTPSTIFSANIIDGEAQDAQPIVP